jgi:hypothetical protein
MSFPFSDQIYHDPGCLSTGPDLSYPESHDQTYLGVNLFRVANETTIFAR